MRLLLTGYPGFLSVSIKDWFKSKGWSVDTLGLQQIPENITKTGTHFVCDLTRDVPQLPPVCYDLVIHAVGKAHVVPKSAEECKSFFDVNVTGTQHVF